MEINWTLVAQLPLFAIILWLFTHYMTLTFPTITGKRICLLIAHPDDEAMFFAPTLLRLSKRQLQNQIFILCLSSGDADGLGHIRKDELRKSALQLGITHPDHVVILEDPRFKDGMGVMGRKGHWKRINAVFRTLQRYQLFENRAEGVGRHPDYL